MDNDIKKPILYFIDTLLTLKGWYDINQPILFQGDFSNQSKNFHDYFDNELVLKANLENPNYKLLFETLISYDLAIEDDWLPDSIEGLSIPRAHLLLKEIKSILEEDIPDKYIEKELIDRYHKVKTEMAIHDNKKMFELDNESERNTQATKEGEIIPEDFFKND
jgi:hypothetical protein